MAPGEEIGARIVGLADVVGGLHRGLGVVHAEMILDILLMALEGRADHEHAVAIVELVSSGLWPADEISLTGDQVLDAD